MVVEVDSLSLTLLFGKREGCGVKMARTVVEWMIMIKAEGEFSYETVKMTAEITKKKQLKHKTPSI